ncbi:MAG: DUF4167 domain-containing protein [Rhodospirillales bacterium]|jgi:hypothetical protein
MKPNQRRPRSRGNGKRHTGRTHSFDSSGPDGKIRGTAQQVFDKYQSLGRDASSAGDRVAAEGFLQHAEHYFRIIATEPRPAEPRPVEHRPNVGTQTGTEQEQKPATGAVEVPIAETKGDSPTKPKDDSPAKTKGDSAAKSKKDAAAKKEAEAQAQA